MVQKGCASTFIRKCIEREKIKRMKPWSLRTNANLRNKSGSMKSRTKDIRYILNIVSGGDIVDMLKDILTVKEQDQLTSVKYKKALINLSEHYSNSPVKQRHNIVRPLKSANFKRAEVRRLGFSTGSILWKSCMNTKERNLGGGVSISDDVQDSIKQHLKENSRIASNRLTLMKDSHDTLYNQKVPTRYLEDRISELWKSFPLKDQLSRTTFYNYVAKNNIFKKPNRLSDLCEYCEEGIRLRDKIIQSLKEHNHPVEEPIDFEKLLHFFKQKSFDLHKHQLTLQDESLKGPAINNLEKVQQLVDFINDYVVIQFHQKISKTQRSAYNLQRKNVELLRGKILIEMDYKEKIVIGLSPRQVNSEYYNQTTRSCLGFGVYYVNENNTIDLINVDIISSDLKQDAHATVRNFRFLREQQFFKQVETNQFIVWADCGKHFRCNKVMSYLLDELAVSGIHVNLNFFCEKHGKASRDAHFSQVSKFIHNESLLAKLESSQDIANAINKGQRLANENKGSKSKQITTYALVLDDETRRRLDAISILKYIKILHIESSYNFRTTGNNFEITTSALSDNNDLVKVRVSAAQKDSDDEDDRIMNTADEKVLEPISIDCKNLEAKKRRLRSLLQKIKNEANGVKKDINTDFYKTFEYEDDNSSTTHEDTNINLPLPKYCRQSPGTKKKPGCAQCNISCTYSMEDILHPTKRIGQNDILEELKYHHHPKCRKISGRQRRTDEAARELADHYKFAHNKKEPTFIY